MNGLEGRTLGEFKLLTKIGQGGMGTVYLAEQPALKRRVAVKVLLEELVHGGEFTRRFQREAMLAASINHPGLVQVHAAGETDGIHYIAMEYVDGESLQRRLEREGRLKLADALDIITRLARSLDYAWQKARLIHRDIKPSNVLLTTDGDVKLADFGMARNADTDSSLTATGMPIGTPLYISPELARCNREIDFTSDIYSLGCTLYHLLSGRAPYIADASFAVMLQHVTEPPPSILQHMPDCPPAVVRLLDRMLAKETKQRHASYAELVEQLQAAQAGGVVEPPRRPPPRRAWAVAALVLVAGLALYFGKSALSVGTPRQALATAPDTAKAESSTESVSPIAIDDFARSVAALPVEARAARVFERLKELNPGFQSEGAKHSIEKGHVTTIEFNIGSVTDLSPLRALPGLKQVKLGQHGLRGTLQSLESLRGLRLEILDVHNSPVSDLSPLTGMPLKWLVCQGSRVTNLAPLKGMPLSGLGINATSVTDLTPLKGMPLRQLNVGITQVSDLSPLADTPLIDLNCSRTPVRDLTPVAGLALTRLICDRTSITDLTPIRGMPLTEITCDFVRERDAEILRSITTLRTINGQAADEFWRNNP